MAQEPAFRLTILHTEVPELPQRRMMPDFPAGYFLSTSLQLTTLHRPSHSLTLPRGKRFLTLCFTKLMSRTPAVILSYETEPTTRFCHTSYRVQILILFTCCVFVQCAFRSLCSRCVVYGEFRPPTIYRRTKTIEERERCGPMTVALLVAS